MPKIFVGNIPHASSDVELQQWVEAQGFQVESAQIIRDRSTGQSRGFGFVVLNEEWKLKEAITALVDAIRDTEVEVRGAAVYALGEIGPMARSAIPAVSKALKDEDAGVRKAAAVALGKIQEPDNP